MSTLEVLVCAKSLGVRQAMTVPAVFKVRVLSIPCQWTWLFHAQEIMTLKNKLKPSTCT